MFCDRCGTQLPAQAAACPSCRKTFVPLMPSQGNIAGHVRLLGILWLAHAAFRFLPGLFMAAFFQRMFVPSELPYVYNFFPVIGAFLIVSALIALAIGCGLLMRQSWARMLAIVFGAIGLIEFPFGMALGIYTL